MARPCIERGCGQLTERTRCALHERARDRQRGSPTQRGYDAEYQRNRVIVLAEGRRCYSQGCSDPATTVDHIVPLRRGGDNSLRNLRASCVTHNYGWRRGG